jgi:hypothetical protein
MASDKSHRPPVPQAAVMVALVLTIPINSIAPIK